MWSFVYCPFSCYFTRATFTTNSIYIHQYGPFKVDSNLSPTGLVQNPSQKPGRARKWHAAHEAITSYGTIYVFYVLLPSLSGFKWLK